MAHQFEQEPFDASYFENLTEQASAELKQFIALVNSSSQIAKAQAIEQKLALLVLKAKYESTFSALKRSSLSAMEIWKLQHGQPITLPNRDRPPLPASLIDLSTQEKLMVAPLAFLALTALDRLSQQTFKPPGDYQAHLQHLTQETIEQALAVLAILTDQGDLDNCMKGINSLIHLIEESL